MCEEDVLLELCKDGARLSDASLWKIVYCKRMVPSCQTHVLLMQSIVMEKGVHQPHTLAIGLECSKTWTLDNRLGTSDSIAGQSSVSQNVIHCAMSLNAVFFFKNGP